MFYMEDNSQLLNKIFFNDKNGTLLKTNQHRKANFLYGIAVQILAYSKLNQSFICHQKVMFV